MTQAEKRLRREANRMDALLGDFMVSQAQAMATKRPQSVPKMVTDALNRRHKKQ